MGTPNEHAEQLISFVGQCVGQADPHHGVAAAIEGIQTEAEVRGARAVLAAVEQRVSEWPDSDYREGVHQAADALLAVARGAVAKIEAAS